MLGTTNEGSPTLYLKVIIHSKKRGYVEGERDLLPLPHLPDTAEDRLLLGEVLEA